MFRKSLTDVIKKNDHQNQQIPQFVTQKTEGLVNLRLYSPYRSIHGFSDFLIFQSVYIAEDKHLPATLRQFINGFMQSLPDFNALHIASCVIIRYEFHSLFVYGFK